MTKNVNVVDDLGNRYVPTYAKRAKGLVKNGRARWVDENTICLACPPDDMNLEDAKMENKINPIENIVVEQNEKVNPNLAATLRVAEKIGNRNSISATDILDRMDRIIAQGDAFMEVVQKIKDLPVNESPEGGQDGANRAMAIGEIYRARETTNQKMLAMLEVMYNDMMGRSQQGARREMNRFEALTMMDFTEVDPSTARLIINAIMGNNPA